MPTFISHELVEEIFDTEQHSKPIMKLREGLNTLGLHEVSYHLYQMIRVIASTIA